MEARKKVTLSYILEKKANGEKLSRTALYDYPMAVLAEEAGIEIINMGDSIATVMLGHKTTNEADLDVAKQYDTNWKAVERNIRTVGGVIWTRSRPLLEQLARRPLAQMPCPAQLLAILSSSLLSPPGSPRPAPPPPPEAYPS